MAKDNCRVCLNEGPSVNIFDNGESVTISSKIMNIAKIQIYPDDGLPKLICLHCLEKLNLCTEFIHLCESTDLKLRNQLNKDTDLDKKKELLDFNYFDDCKYSPRSDSEKELLISENDSICTGDTPMLTNQKIVKGEIKCPIVKGKHKNAKNTQKQQCFTCGKVMSSRFRLKTHLRTHTGERPYSCTQCGKNFSLMQNLKVHMRIHTGEKPLHCTICGEAFAQSAGLAAHKRKHTGQTPYRCMLCPRSFRTVGHLQYHVRRHTGEKNFECDTCGRAFITRSDLKQHLLIHTGEKPHVCSICGLRLTRASHLKRHIQSTHTGRQQFVCKICPLKFSQKGDLKKHRKVHASTNNDSEKE